MKKALLVAIIGALTLNVSAGDWGGKAPISAKNPKSPIGCPDTSGEVSVGYMTDYILHGARLNRDTVWLDAHYTFNSMVPITIGVSHFDGHGGFIAPTALDETDAYISAALGNFGGFDVVLDYTHRFYHGTINSTGEIGLTLRRDIGFADLILGTDYLLSGIGPGATGGWVHRGRSAARHGAACCFRLAVGIRGCVEAGADPGYPGRVPDCGCPVRCH